MDIAAFMGTLVGVGGLVVAMLQLRVSQRSPTSSSAEIGRSVAGASVSPPTGLLPAEVLGREDILGVLQRAVARPSGFVVLAGMGGVGKSTVAMELACRIGQQRPFWHRTREWVVWWVSASDPASLSMGAVSIAKQAGGTEADIEAVATGAPDGPDRLWKLLRNTRFRWLLVFDNADDPTVLCAPQPWRPVEANCVAGGTGWVRANGRGLTIVTSRLTDPATWGNHAEIELIQPLQADAAARVLTHLAPSAGDIAAARRLSQQLGGLPLALHVAGSYLSQPLARWKTFTAYSDALNDGEPHSALAFAGRAAEARGMIMRTWELSLDHLADHGLAQARPVLRMLSCFAAVTPIPVALLDPQLMAPLFAGVRDVEGQLDRVLAGLIQLGLVSTTEADAVTIHPVIASSCRTHMAAPGPDELDSAVVRATAVELVAAKCTALDFSSPQDWPWFASLTPHLHALLSLPLEPQALGKVCRAAAKTSLSYDWSGGLHTAVALTTAALTASASLGPEHESVLRLQQQAILQRGRSGFWAEAEADFNVLVEIERRVLGDNHPVTLSTLHDLGRSYAHGGRWQEAEAMAMDVVTRRTQVFGHDHPATLASRHHLARAYAAQHRWPEADATFTELLADERRVLGEEHPTTLATRDGQARSLTDQERWPDAEAAYQELLESRRRVLGEEHPTTLTNLFNLARAIERQGRRREAEQIYGEVLTLRQRALGEQHPETVETEQALVRLR
ncbi:tetratricopeptide repeat protein [Streptomyces sp. NBC_00510]